MARPSISPFRSTRIRATSASAARRRTPNNALIVKGTAFLFDRETDDVRFTFNKAAAGDDVALTFQTNYSARALFGLLGDDDFTVKMGMMDGMGWAMGVIWLLVLIVLVLGIAALAKYLFFQR